MICVIQFQLLWYQRGVGWGELFTSFFRAVTVTCNNYYSMIDERSKAFGQLLGSTTRPAQCFMLLRYMLKKCVCVLQSCEDRN